MGTASTPQPGLTTGQLHERLATQTWTAHNIRLTDDVTTIPGTPDFFTTDTRLHAIERTLRTLYGGYLNGRRVADLGSLEGGYAVALAQRDADVVGVEVRSKNMEKLELIVEHFALPRLRFVQDDVKNFTVERYGLFDVVLALGILYHLDHPVEWLTQIAATVTDALIVDTHFAPADDRLLRRVRPDLAHLGRIEEHRAGDSRYRGRWFFEYPPDTERESQLWASYSNNQSFWLTKESLLVALHRAGFDLILEQHDWTVERHEFFAVEYPRAMFVAVKTGAFSAKR